MAAFDGADIGQKQCSEKRIGSWGSHTIAFRSAEPMAGSHRIPQAINQDRTIHSNASQESLFLARIVVLGFKLAFLGL